MNDKLKRKVEVEEKLEILNGKKHNLVQLLKQVSVGLSNFLEHIDFYNFNL